MSGFFMEGFHMADFIQQLEWMARILMAGACGGIIGYERESRKKTAGLRTHVIVAVSSALMLILSKYGFQDVTGQYVRVDPSRMAAGAVAFGALLGPAGLLGVGFFGALCLGWLYLTGLGPSACLAAFVWDGVRRGERGIAPALVYTILLLIPAADAIAAVVLFLAARPGDGTRAAGKANR